MLDGDFFEQLADISFGDQYTQKYPISLNRLVTDKKVPIIYVDNYRLLELFETIKYYNKEVIIIGHNSDANYDDSIIQHIPKNVKQVWCQNYNGVNTDIIKPLPIGLERKLWFPNIRKQDILQENINIYSEKQIEVYMNFNPATNSIRNRWYEYFKNKSYVYTEMLGNGNDYRNYINKLKQSKFVLSPIGNGIDCHRNWECLYLNVVPIIERNMFNAYIYSDMNVLLVDDIQEVNQDILNNYVTKTNYKLDCEYWRKLITQYAE